MTSTVPTSDAYFHIRNCEQAGDYFTSFALREQSLADLVTRIQQLQSSQGAAASDVNDVINQHQKQSLEGELALQAEELVRLYCCVALDALNRNEFTMSFDLLQKAQRLVEHGKGLLFPRALDQLRIKARATVLNNLGLFYFRTGDYTAAIENLSEAHDVERNVLGIALSDNPGATMINLAQALIAAEENARAVPVLRNAVVVLTEQSRAASVTIQAEDAANLSIHAMSLLGHCLEATGDFNGAADTFAKAIEMLKPRRHSTPDAPTFENRMRSMQEDMRRCQEKALRLPGIPLRATRPQRVVPPRDRRGTKEHTQRLQMVSGHPHMQHERIVTSTLPTAVPSTYPHPSAAGRPSTATQPAPITYSTIRLSTYHPPTPRMNALELQKPLSRAVSQTSKEESEHPRGQQQHDANETVVPAGAVDATLATGRRTAPEESRHAFATAPGLQTIYHKLTPEFQEAFDSLAKLSYGSNVPNVTSTVPHAPMNTVYPETVLFGFGGSGGPAIPAHPSRRPSRQAYERPWVQSTQPGKGRPASAGVGRAPSSSNEDHAAAGPRPGIPTRPLSGRPVKPQLTRQESATSNPVAAAMVAQPHTMTPTHSSDGGPTFSEPQSDVVAVQENPSSQRRKQSDVIASCVSAKLSQRVVASVAESMYGRLIERKRLREEEAARAKAEAQRMLERERLQMQRELSEAKLLMQSRRRVSGPLLLTSPATGMHRASLDGEEKDQQREEALHLKVQKALHSHAVVATENAVSIASAAELKEAIDVRTEETLERRDVAFDAALRFCLFAISVREVSKRIQSCRERGHAAFADKMQTRQARRRIERFLLMVIMSRRVAHARFAAEAQEYAKLVRAVNTTTTFMRGLQSTHAMQRALLTKYTKAVLCIQSAGKGFRTRVTMSFVKREFASSEARRTEHAGKVILRTLRHNVRRNKAQKRWDGVEVENMLNKQTFAATLIQSHWRRYKYGRPYTAVWQERLAERQRAERLRLEGIARAAQVLQATSRIKRAYRVHLARRQLHYRRMASVAQRQKYLVSEMRSRAALALQRFCRIVRAKAAVKARRATIDAYARTRRLVYDIALEDEKRSHQMTSIRLLQRAGRAYHVRQRLPFYYSSLIKSTMHERSSRLVAFVQPRSVDSDLSGRDAASSPSLFMRGGSSMTSMNGNESAIAAAATSILRLLKQSSSTTSLQTEEAGCETDDANLPIPIHFPTAVSTPTTTVATTPTTAAVSQTTTLTRDDAVRRIVRFFRIVQRQRRAARHRAGQRTDTIRNESARFIQDAWRRYSASRRMQHRRAVKQVELRDVVLLESAMMIQRAFRAHMARRVAA